jgi:hypothetical protein
MQEGLCNSIWRERIKTGETNICVCHCHMSIVEKQYMRNVPIVPFPTDVGTNSKNSVHSSVLDLFEEPHDVVVSLKVVLQVRKENAYNKHTQKDPPPQ